MPPKEMDEEKLQLYRDNITLLLLFQKQVEFDRPGERSPEQDCCC